MATNADIPSLAEGKKAPEIKLETDDGAKFKLSSLKGKKVVIYFYPKADTPGCTTESCQFRDAVSEFQALGVEVVGISPDTPTAQAKFKSKFDLTFPLLADSERTVAMAYGVWVEKNMYGKKSMGIERSTFVIGEDGKIVKIYRKVKADGHAAKVLADIKAMG
ncbi:MAG: thioredoxin-dependent thiol peroxidase [Bryobacterales bacterium]|nr:thioredoxin-dependent thiol peroxidase [Bryobacterales bacterium]